MYNIPTSTTFGDLRSSVEREYIPGVLQSLRLYKGEMRAEDLLHYVKSKLGYIPSHDWVGHHCSSDPYHAYNMRKEWLGEPKPLKAFINVANQRYCIAEWENPFPVLFTMCKPYRDGLIQSHSESWLKGLVFSPALITAQELEYLHSYNEASNLDDAMIYRGALTGVIRSEPLTLRFKAPYCRALYQCLDPQLLTGFSVEGVIDILGDKPSYILMKSVSSDQVKLTIPT